MGNTPSLVKKNFAGNGEMRILIIGLTDAGKSTIIEKLNPNTVVDTFTVSPGMTFTKFDHKDIDFVSWDVGGSAVVRTLWRHFFPSTAAVIFVVDSSDSDHLDEARSELSRLIAEPELQDPVLLVFANKQDLEKSVPVSDLIERLHLESLDSNTWKIQESVATTGQGLREGMDWLSDALKQRT